MGSTSRHQDYLQFLLDEAGDDLMGVGAAWRDGEEAEFEVLYLRDDVEAILDDDVLDRIADEIVFHALEEQYRRDSFGFGTMQYAINRYQGTVAIVHGNEDGSGTLTSLDPATDLDLVAIAERGLEILE